MGRAPCCDKANVKKGPWSPEEDAKLKSYIDQNGTGGNWIALPQKIGLKRCGKSCRLRWLNYLRPNLKHGGFSEEEDNIICSLYISIGSRWSIIAAQLPGRTDNDIKNYWNTRLKKKLLGRQRKEQAIAAQARRRRPNNFSPKQEIVMKREIVNSHGSPNNFDGDNTSPIDHHHHHLQSRFASSYHAMSQADQAPNYWPPELPLAMPAAQESDQQASLKNLLAKLGGRFSEGSATTCSYAFPAVDHDHHHHHLMVSSAQDQAYQASNFDALASSTSYGGGESSSGHQSVIFQLGLENLQAELSELINYSNYQQADDQLVVLDGDYGANYSKGFTSANSATSLDSSSSSLVNYHSNHMVSDHHHSQLHQDNSAFDQVSSCYFGAYDNITI